MIPLARPYLKGNELKYISRCIKSGWISSIGSFVTKFEDCFADYSGCKYGISTSNGTVALHLALKILGIGKGDEVILPDLTFVASANAVTYTQAKPVFVDAKLSNWNIDTSKIEGKINKRTKAIMAVHLYGNPAEMDPILRLAQKYKLYVVEDACEAHGAFYKGKRVGSLSDLGVFSFYGNKIITTGEGGMITTNNKQIAQRAKFLRDHAMSAKRRYFRSLSSILDSARMRVVISSTVPS